MTKHLAALPNVQLDPTAQIPLYHQLYEGIRVAILSGQLRANSRLPSSRALAEEFGISRNTVLEAYAQLLAEGYVESQTGSGTYVAQSIPDTILNLRTAPSTSHESPPVRMPSQRGKMLAATSVSVARESGPTRAFQAGIPAFETFPFEIWSRLMALHWRQPPTELLTYGDPAGYMPLRIAITDYLRAARGVRCTPEQVIIVAGSQQGLDLTTRVLLDIGNSAWVEDPGYMGARGALQSAGTKLVPVPVDQEGLRVDYGVERYPKAKLAYITPSHQFPLGVTMSLSRRLALLEWANREGAWILEDDYDSEYRYTGRPLPALQGLDTHNRTVYLGTLSKTLFPSLRLGYLVVPPDLVGAFVSAKALVDRQAPSVEQAVLATFMTDGHFERHIRRTRVLYAERQAMLLEAVERHLHGLLDVQAAESGMHLIGYLPEGVDDQVVSRLAAEQGLEVQPLSAYSLQAEVPSGLVLGYTAFTQSEINEGVRRLAPVLRAAQKEAQLFHSR